MANAGRIKPHDSIEMNSVVGKKWQPDGALNKWGKPTSKNDKKSEPLKGQSGHLEIVHEQAGLGKVERVVRTLPASLMDAH